MEGKAGFQAILSDPSLEAVVLVLPPNIALQVRQSPVWLHRCTDNVSPEFSRGAVRHQGSLMRQLPWPFLTCV